MQSGTKMKSIYKIPMSIDFYFKNRIINKTILIEGKNTVHRITKILSHVKLSNIKRKKFNDITYEL